MKAKTKEQRKADAEAAQELLNSPVFVSTLGKLTEMYVEGVMKCLPGHDKMFDAVYKLQAIKAIRDDIQSVADDLKMLHGADGTT